MDSQTQTIFDKAISLHKNDHLYQAEILYRQVITEEPYNIDAHHYLGLLLLNIDKADESIPLLRKAYQLQPNNADLCYNLALAFQKTMQIIDAISFYQKTLLIDPNYSLAYNNLGIAYQHLGDIENANHAFISAIDRSPDCVEAHYNFAQSNRFTENDQEKIDGMEKLLKINGLIRNDQIKLNFALGKIFDDLKFYDKAFSYYKVANDLKHQHFNASLYQSYVDHIIQVFQNLPLAGSVNTNQTNIINENKKRFIFIVGMPRSGTTLIEQIISSHSAVQSAGETGFIGELIDNMPVLSKSDAAYPFCLAEMTTLQFSKIAEQIQLHLSTILQEINIVTDKSPINFFHIGLILLLFPDSKIIHVNRNPIDTCLSCYFQNFEKQHLYSYDLSTLAMFHNEYIRLMSYWKNTFGDNIFTIDYEDLVNDQEYQSKRILSYCDLKWQDKCLDFYKSKSAVNTASKWQVRQPVYTSSINRWKNYRTHLTNLLKYLN